MSNESKTKSEGENQATGKDGATTSSGRSEKSENSTNHLDGQQGAGGIGGLGERTTPNPTGSQPHLGGADAPKRAGTPGTGLTEDSDPASRGGLPDLADPRPTHAGQTDSRGDG